MTTETLTIPRSMFRVLELVTNQLMQPNVEDGSWELDNSMAKRLCLEIADGNEGRADRLFTELDTAMTDWSSLRAGGGPVPIP